MREHHIPKPGQSFHFVYYASAFLGAAVSVVYILEDLAGDAFRSWLREWRRRLTDVERQQWSSLQRRRGSEVHSAGPRRRRTIRWNPPAPESSTPWVFDDEGGNRADMLDTCQHYLVLIGRLVRDFRTHSGLVAVKPVPK